MPVKIGRQAVRNVRSAYIHNCLGIREGEVFTEPEFRVGYAPNMAD